jgi:hypothetical protein
MFLEIIKIKFKIKTQMLNIITKFFIILYYTNL